jgi:hypothetical protein
MRPLLRLGLLLPFLFLPLGCAKKTAPLAPVSGRVTLDGKPLAGALVRFQPQQRDKDPNMAPDALGHTDDQGNYTLSTVLPTGEEKAGAVIGRHNVQISLFDYGDGKRQPGERVPAKYNTESKETYEVPAAGANQANFELFSKK